MATLSTCSAFIATFYFPDNHIQSEINTRKLALLAQPLAIMPADKNNPDDVALAAAFTRAKSDCENWRDGMLALMDSNVGWPVSVVEKIMKPAGEPADGEAEAAIHPQAPGAGEPRKCSAVINGHIRSAAWPPALPPVFRLIQTRANLA